MTEEIKRLSNLIQSSSRIVFFGGAGVSTESGIEGEHTFCYNEGIPEFRK